jgi:dolichyl-phosphate beta-glucosyltransferase
MYGFHFWLWCFGVKHIKDTQCGFKLFTRPAARIIFPSMHMQGWVFDVEILHLALSQNIPVAEVPIRWEEIDGSKLNIMQDAFKMARDVVLIRLNYFLGVWSVSPVSTQHLE